MVYLGCGGELSGDLFVLLILFVVLIYVDCIGNGVEGGIVLF